MDKFSQQTDLALAAATYLEKPKKGLIGERALWAITLGLALITFWLSYQINHAAGFPRLDIDLLVFTGVYTFSHVLIIWNLPPGKRLIGFNTSLLLVGAAVGYPTVLLAGAFGILPVILIVAARSLLVPSEKQGKGYPDVRTLLWMCSGSILLLIILRSPLEQLHDALHTTHYTTEASRLLILLIIAYVIPNAFSYLIWQKMTGYRIRKTLKEQLRYLLILGALPPLFIPILIMPYYAWENFRLPSILFYIIGAFMINTIYRYMRILNRRVLEFRSLNSMGQSLSSTLYKEDLYKIIYQEVGKIFDVSGIYLAIYDSEHQTISFPIYYRDNIEMTISDRPFKDKGLTEHIIISSQSLSLNEDPIGSAAKIGLNSIGQPAKCYLGVPVIAGNEVIGVLALRDYRQSNIFTPHHVQLLETVAAQAGSAIRNADLYQTSQKQAQELRSLNQISILLSTGPSLDELVGTVCRVIIDIMHSDQAAVFLLNSDQNFMQIVGSVGLSETYQTHSQTIALDADRSTAIEKAEKVIVSDTTTETRYPNAVALVEEENIRAVIDIPMKHNDQVVGSLTAYYSLPHIFTQDEISLMETLSGQVAVAIENTRLFTEMHERSKMLEALYAASTAINTSLSLNHVLKKIARSLINILDLESCTTYLLEDDERTLTAQIRMAGTGYAVIEAPTNNDSIILPNYPVIVEALKDHRIILIDKGESPLLEQGREMVERAYVKTGMILPLVSKSELMGLIIAGHIDDNRSISDDDTRLALAITTQAAVALQNAKLFARTDEALQNRVDELSSLSELSQKITRSLDFDSIMNEVLQAAQLATNSEFGEVASYDKATKTLHVIARSDGYVDNDHWKIDQGITGKALHTGKTIRVADVRDHRGYFAFRQETLSELVVPIILDEQRLGIINLESSRIEAFTAAHARFVGNLADHAALAIQNATLFEAEERRAEVLTTLKEISLQIISSTDMQHLLRVISEEALKQSGAHDIHIYLYDESKKTLTFGASLWQTGEVDKEFATPRPDGLTMHVAQTGERVLIKDPNSSRFAAGHYGEFPMVSLPIKKGDEVVGVFNLAFSIDAPFTDENLHFLELLAAQAGVAIANARLVDSEREQRDIAELLLRHSESVTSSIDLEQVLLTLADSMFQISDFQMCLISQWAAESEQLRSLVDYSRAVWDDTSGEEYSLATYITPAQVIETGQPINIYLGMDGSDQAILEWIVTIGISSFWMLPLYAGDTVIGIAEIASTTMVFAENITALESSQRILEKAAQSLIAPLADNPPEYLLSISEELFNVHESTSFASLSLWDKEANLVRTITDYNNSIWPPGTGYPINATERPSIQVALESNSPTVFHRSDRNIPDGDLAKITRWGAKTLVTIPISNRGKPIGIIELYNIQEERDVSDDDLSLWKAIADQASVALLNAELATETQIAHDQMKIVINSINDGILMFDTEGNLILANPRVEQLLNFKSDESIGIHFMDILIGASLRLKSEEMAEAGALQELQKIMGSPDQRTERNYTLNKPISRVIEEFSFAVLGANDDMLGRLFIFRDATQEYELEAYKKELADMIVHDLRSPLSGVISGLSIAIDEFNQSPDDPDLDTIKQTIDIGYTSANKLLALIETIMDISKLESGQMAMIFEPLNLKGLAESQFSTLKSMADEAEITVTIIAPTPLPDIIADKEKVERIFINLIDNALRYTPIEGSIRVEITAEDDTQTFSVIDSGEGIPDEYHDLIFDRFVQVNMIGRMRGSKGSGLGLTFCQFATEAHGGHIWVTNDKNGGAAFHVRLPIAQDEIEEK